MSRDLASALARGLQRAGATTIFGVPGGGPNLDMIGAAQELGIDFVLAHNETAACVMAASHGRALGGVGVAVVTRGPGLTSAINGLAQATLDRYALILISDTVPARESHRVAHQRIDQVALAAPVTKWSGVLGNREPEATVAAAAALALASPPGAVHLAFDPTQAGQRPPAPAISTPVDPDLLASVQARISTAERPLVILGAQAIDDFAAVRLCLASLDVPIMVTYQASGLVPDSWPNHVGYFTNAAADAHLIAQADLVIGVGLDGVEPMPGSWRADTPTVLFNSYQADTAYFTGATVVECATGADVDISLNCVTAAWRPETIPLATALLALESSRKLRPQDVAAIVRASSPEASATVDAGAHMLVAMPMWQADRPGDLLISNGLATMGFALPAAIGIAVARPYRRVICMTGDGGLGMVLGELEVLRRRQLDVTVVVFNDATLTLIRLKQTQGQQSESTVHYSPIDFAAVAAAMGLESRVVTDEPELRSALAELDGLPSLIDVRLDPSDYADIIRTARG
ncbi:MAG: thiamine pyrophosphate-binding protein [Candidatus Nanopelagicales bacterium]